MFPARIQSVPPRHTGCPGRTPGIEAAGADGHNRAGKLSTLARPHDRGMLSDEEFERAKASVLT